jgi:hypothetical protein
MPSNSPPPRTAPRRSSASSKKPKKQTKPKGNFLASLFHNPEPQTKNRVMGGIGVLWGGGAVVAGLIRESPDAAGGAYASGASLGFAMMVLMFFVGLFYLIRG